VLWALAAGGDTGEGGADAVAWLLSGMAADLRHAMTLAGARDVGELTPDLVV
jgi:4-hydroxymandelate oxidase